MEGKLCLLNPSKQFSKQKQKAMQMEEEHSSGRLDGRRKFIAFGKKAGQCCCQTTPGREFLFFSPKNIVRNFMEMDGKRSLLNLPGHPFPNTIASLAN